MTSSVETSWTREQLRAELKRRNLPSSGTKQQLLDRLKQEDGVMASDTAAHTDSEVSDAHEYETWTVQKLQTELRAQGLPSSGKKVDLVERLKNSPSRSRSASKTPTRRAATPRRGRGGRSAATGSSSSVDSSDAANSKEDQGDNAESLTLLKQPLLTMQYFALALFDYFKEFVAFCRKHTVIFAIVALLAVTYAVLLELDNPYQQATRKATAVLLWYGYWVVLGIASSIGLGTGLHTFLLFLGPFIARVTLFAYDCGSTNFETHGSSSFQCDSSFVSMETVTSMSIYAHIALETFAWGAGTAIGELPPYFVARAAALAGRSDDELDHIETIKRLPAKKRSLWDNVQVAMFELMHTFGFFGILAAASIPNPLFDLAGITCGHFLIPLSTFFAATFIGKAFVKATIQAFFIVFLFSKDIMEYVLAVLQRRAPVAHTWANQFLKQQRHRFTNDQVAQSSDSLVGTLWNSFIALMIAYFLMSIVQSLATSRYNKKRQ